MAQLSRVHPRAEGVVSERVSRGPFIKPPAKRVVADFGCNVAEPHACGYVDFENFAMTFHDSLSE